jgi:hypothetical protein
MLNEKLTPKFDENCESYGKCYLVEEMFCIVFHFFDKVWVESNASYMDFGSVIKKVEEQMLLILQKKPTSFNSFKFLLGLDE